MGVLIDGVMVFLVFAENTLADPGEGLIVRPA